MPYAANGQIAELEFEGSIKITQAQYVQALEGMCGGLVVSIDDGFKVAPPVLPEAEPQPEPTLEELAAAALAQRDYLLGVAAIRIAPLQDAVDLERATPEGVAMLKQWKGYRVDLNEIDQQEGFPQHIEWPRTPGASALDEA